MLMCLRVPALTIAAILLPGIVAAQGTAPVAQAFREYAGTEGKNLIAAAELMPADKYSFKPTPAQMSFGEVVMHLAGGNDYLCGGISGTAAPTRPTIAATASKEALIARLKETFQFCGDVLAKLDDSKLTEPVEFFGRKMSRAMVMTLTTGDWADHYSQSAIYLRLNGILPPTAKSSAP
jgi:hypothetical protein